MLRQKIIHILIFSLVGKKSSQKLWATPSSINQPTNVLSQPGKNKMSFQSIARGSHTENCSGKTIPRRKGEAIFSSQVQVGADFNGTVTICTGWVPGSPFGSGTGAHSSCSSHCPSETQRMLRATGFLGTDKPRPPHRTQDTDWDVNYSQPIHQKDVVPVHAWDWPVPSHGEPPRNRSALRKIPSRYSPTRNYRAQSSLLQRRWGTAHNPRWGTAHNFQLSWGVQDKPDFFQDAQVCVHLESVCLQGHCGDLRVEESKTFH